MANAGNILRQGLLLGGHLGHVGCVWVNEEGGPNELLNFSGTFDVH